MKIQQNEEYRMDSTSLTYKFANTNINSSLEGRVVGKPTSNEIFSNGSKLSRALFAFVSDFLFSLCVTNELLALHEHENVSSLLPNQTTTNTSAIRLDSNRPETVKKYVGKLEVNPLNAYLILN